MTRTLRWLGLCLLLAGQALIVCGATDQPRYDVEHYNIFLEVHPTDNRMEALTDIRVKILDKTNYITLRLNGNLLVTSITDETNTPVRYIQDDTEKFDVMVNFGPPVEPGTVKTLHLQYNGIFPKSEFDFFQEIGNSLYSYIGPDAVELYASAFWFPSSTNPLDRANYEIQATLPTGLQPITAGRQTDMIDAGLTKTYVFQTDNEVLPPSLVAGRYLVHDLDEDGVRLKGWFLSELPDADAVMKSYVDIVKYLDQQESFSPGMFPLNIVEVSDKCPEPYGMDNVVFLTTRELKANRPKLRDIIRKFAYQKWLFPLQLRSPYELWIVEGLAQYTAALYVLNRKGEEGFQNTMQLLAVDALKYYDLDTIHQGFRLGIGSEKYDSVVVAKSAWVFHMLRNMVGPDTFKKITTAIFEEGQKEPLDTTRIDGIVDRITGKDYGWFFNEWIDTVDLPQFNVEYLVYRLTSGGFQIVGKINQNIAVFRSPLQIKIITKGQDEFKTVDIDGESTRLNLKTETRPTQLIIDPEFRVLRKSRDLEIQVHLVKGDELMDNKDFLGAIDEYKEAIQMEPRDSLAYYKLARVFYEQFNYNSALNTFRDALNGNQKPDWVVADSYLYIGKIFDVLGQRQRAIAEYNKAINTKDNSRGAVDEAQKHLGQPFTREKTFLTNDDKKGDGNGAPAKPPQPLEKTGTASEKK